MPSLPKIDAIGLKILFLLIPGIIVLGIVKSIGQKRPRSDFESGLQIFLYGVFCYLITGIIEGLYLWNCLLQTDKSFWQTIAESGLGLATLNSTTGLDSGQIALASIVALFVGVFVAYFEQHSIPHSFLRKIGITQRTNDVGIWELTLNSPDLNNWVTVRHHDNGKVYQGWVRAYSDGGDERELLLTEVTVYATLQNTNELIEVDNIPVLYLGIDRKNAVLELTQKMKKETP